MPRLLAVTDCNNPQTLAQKQECLLPDESELIGGSTQGTVQLASGDLQKDFIPFFVNMGTGVAGTLIFISFVYAGYLMVFSNDKEESIDKGKKILTYSVIGAIVIAISYAVVYGIIQLDLD